MIIENLPGALLDLWVWQEQGLCRDAETDSFYYADGERGPARIHREQAAKAICSRCPVIQDCVRHALTVPEHYGVWGGMTEDERAPLIAAMANLKAVN